MDDVVRVLHVDDEPDFLEICSSFLERADDDFEVITETSAEAGLDRLQTDRVDCIVSDYQMPGTDGLEFLEAVREEHPDLPFVLFTGRGSEEVASDAIAAGATGYLQKDSGTGQYELLANRVRNAVERYRAERETEATEERFRKLLADAADYIHVLDSDGTVEYVTPSIERVLGYEPAEVVGTDCFELVHPDDREEAEETFEGIVGDPEAERTIEVRMQDADGSWRWLSVKSRNLLDDPVIEGVVGNVRDVTERKRRRAELEERESLLESIFDQVPIHLYVKDEEARYRRVSRAYVEDAKDGGYPRSAADFLGKTDTEIFDAAFAEETYEDDLRVIEEGEPILDKEEYVPVIDEWNLTSKVPWREGGEVRGLFGVSRKITERKERERELERQNERLEEFASIVSHDLRNPLNTLAGAIELAEESGDPEAFDRCRRVVDRMERQIEDLLALAREGRTIDETAPVSLANVVEAAGDSVGTGLDLQVETDRVVEADEDRLRRLFENLLGNAVEHGSTGSQDSPDDAVEHGTASERESSVVVTVAVGTLSDDEGFYVADDGAGIPPEERERVFETGYSTAREGTGYGLSIVEEIAEAHGWSIDVTESEEGGARFEVDGVEFAD